MKLFIYKQNVVSLQKETTKCRKEMVQICKMLVLLDKELPVFRNS